MPERGDDTQPFQARLIAYVDILGWSELTNRGEDQRIRDAFASVERMHAVAKKPNHMIGRFGPVGSTGRETTFSDSIVYSCLVDDWEVELDDPAGAMALLRAPNRGARHSGGTMLRAT
jgi:hypothetical protein